jgi:hypothetical protein
LKTALAAKKADMAHRICQSLKEVEVGAGGDCRQDRGLACAAGCGGVCGLCRFHALAQCRRGRPAGLIKKRREWRALVNGTLRTVCHFPLLSAPLLRKIKKLSKQS